MGDQGERRSRRVARHVTGHLASAACLPADLLALVSALLSAGRGFAPADAGDTGSARTRLPGAWAALHRRRLRRWWAATLPPAPGGGRLITYLAGRVVLGAVGFVIVVSVAGLLVVGGEVVIAPATGGAAPLFDAGPGDVTWRVVGWLLLPGVLLLFVLVQAARSIRDLEVAWFRRCALDRDAVEADLRRTRLEVVDAVDTERRRIERDLHDGVQQSVVSLGLLIGQARRTCDQPARDDLLGRAQDQSLRLLHELRDVVWRIYPAALDAHGLRRVLTDLAEAARVPVGLTYQAPDHLPRQLQAAAYFTAAEAVTNALKHAAPSRVEIRVRLAAGTLEVRVRDDGHGGADADGSGLRGLRARVAALDGTLTVISPPGGPTVIRMVTPCG